LSLPRFARPEIGRRATAIAIALAIECLLLLALLSLGLSSEPPPKPQVTEVSLAAEDVAEPESEAPVPDESEPTQRSAPPRPVETSAPALTPAPAPVALISLPTAPVVPPPAAAPPAPVEGPVYGPPDTGRPRSDDSERVGTAPNGEPLYAAQWYQRPGKEFDGYLSAASPGYGLMACRTIPDFYVTDCVALGETPGSRLTRSMLAGSGVLRVRPPRLGGRSLVGSWVRIRIDYSIRRE
jgi:protein TonB